jgi:hypothetical protein
VRRQRARPSRAPAPGAERDPGRGSVRNPATLAVLILCRAGRRVCVGRPGREPGLSRLRDQHIAAAPYRAGRTPRRPLAQIGCPADHASLRAAVGRHRRRQRRDSRRRAPDGPRAGSCEHLLERSVVALTGDQDATVSDRPRDSDPRMVGEPAKAVPHRAPRARTPARHDPSIARRRARRPRIR